MSVSERNEGRTLTDIDVSSNRAARKYSRKQQVGRVLWALCRPLFCCSPRPLWGCRRLLLRLFGSKVGDQVHVYPSVRITMPWNVTLDDGCAIGANAQIYALGSIRIGARATVSQGAHLCAGTHDITRMDRPLSTPPIVIGPNCWIAADAFIGPGVSIGHGAVVGARAVVMKDVKAGDVVAGNPARTLRNLA